eukprot:CAMPEP_0197587128 /NCGR_PEP_ID=MMETSP1326-20131121/8859_1 /TAXON_ID=1155430 /ORGANISM="Genus nov. species nov., Strain RCC2288" /LENGTH=267 /DNA_ID=CAMNT_0043151819 /DNA_START=26 /DNA_END=826 /DNA_ORIENTATION=+
MPGAGNVLCVALAAAVLASSTLADAAAAAADNRRGLLPVPAADISLNSTAGTALLEGASHRLPWVQLSLHFETQRNQAFCSAATAAIMLNALNAQPGAGLAPVDGMYAPYSYYTQRTLFDNTCMGKIPVERKGSTMNAKYMATHGATLHEWQDYLQCFAPSVKHTHASAGTAAQFRRDVLSAFNGSATSPLRYVGINFLRTVIDEMGGGHMSPIGAYDAATDRVLLLDVSRYKYPPVWSALQQVYDAMNTTDPATHLSRGWVIIGAA